MDVSSYGFIGSLVQVSLFTKNKIHIGFVVVVVVVLQMGLN